MERILLNGIWKLYGKDQKGAGDDIYTLNSVTGRLVHYAVCASTLGKIGGKCLYSRYCFPWQTADSCWWHRSLYKFTCR